MVLNDFNITELSRLLNKSRPTVYKYITDYKNKNFDNIPNSVKELFDRIEGGCTKSDVYAYCESHFLKKAVNNVELKQLIDLIVENEDVINLDKLKKFILGEIKHGRKRN